MNHWKSLVLYTLFVAHVLTYALPLQRRNIPDENTSLIELRQLVSVTESALVSRITKVYLICMHLLYIC